ncbi:MAG: LytTR family DNA-binding domain-containing protein [Lactobacillales bacterium]|jgi:two-component system response regulator AgrA|nr:LytTR family DNA-binding domain-containing protein [Lactobacillales bacterium]
MNIFILEDDFLHQARLEKTIQKIMKKNQWNYRFIEIFEKPQQLLEAIKEKGNHQIYFLDIEIKNKEKKGLEVAEEIRRIDPTGMIVFVTTHSEFAPITYAYKVMALDFIDKAQTEEAFEKSIEECLHYTMNLSSQPLADTSFVYNSPQAQLQIPYNEILYFETAETIHKVCLTTKNERMEFYANLSEIDKKNECFFRCHRSFVVNPENVVRVSKKNNLVYFENGDSCLVSRKKLKELIQRIEKLHSL